jgi:ribosomal protein L5
MKRIEVHKVVINIGVGRSGEPIDKAKNALMELTNQQPAVRGAKKSVRDFGIHKGEPIGVVVTLRHEPAIEFLKRVVAAKNNVLKAYMNTLTSQVQSTTPRSASSGWMLTLYLTGLDIGLRRRAERAPR